MLKELIKKIRNKGIRKIIFSMIGEIVVVAVLIGADDIELVERIICLIIWQIPILRHFIEGIIMATSGKNALLKYVKESGIPFEMLEKEMKFTTKIQNIYIGHTHIFSNNAKEIIVMPIKNIEKVYIRHCGQNYAKGRNGYYYLCLKEKNSNKVNKIYSIKQKALEQAIELIKNKNEDIVVGE